MIPSKIINFLDKSKVKYEKIEHRTVYTAYDKAATLRVSEKIIGKTLVVKFDKTYALVLIPANKNLDKEKLKKIAKTRSADFAKENWMKKNFKGIKMGTTPPFGIIWKIQTFIDKSLIKEPKIFVNSGDYNWSIKIKGSTLKNLIPDLIAGSFTKIKK